MAELHLTQGKVTVFDDGDLPLVSRHRWFAAWDGWHWYAVATIDGKTATMHRLFLGVQGMHVDHINGDGLNNYRSNLRVATPRQNQQNARPRGGSSNYKGVTFMKDRGRWLSRIRVDGKIKHLGFFVDEMEAAMAYDRAARQFFGEFARPNFQEIA